MRERGLLGSSDPRASAPADTHDVVEGVRRRFERFCPRGVVYATDALPPAWLTALPNRDKRRILGDAIAFARDFRPAHHGSPYDVTALAVDGVVRLIFVQDTRTDPRRRGRWRAVMRDANILAVTAMN